MAQKIQFDIEANDHASSVFRSVSSSIGNFSLTANRNLSRFNNTLRAYNSTMRGFSNITYNVMASAGRAVYNFTSDAIKRYAELEKQHAKTMGAMASDYNFNYNGKNDATQQANYQRFTADSALLKQQAIKYGVTGPNNTGSLYSPVEISSAQTAMVKAGIKPADIANTDALQNIMKFAGGNDLELDNAVNFAVQLGTQFKIKPKDWGGMLDQVTYAANASVIDVPDIIQSMKYAGNMASGFDQPLSDILTALAIMGNAGLKGSQAGTGIQALFSRSMSTTGVTTAGPPPTKNVEGIYKGFAGKVVDKNGNFMGLENYTEVFDEATSTLNDQEKSWFVKKLFGMFQQKAALALGRTDEDGNILFGEMSDNIIKNSAGTNDTMFQLTMASLGGQLEALNNAYIGFKQGFGEGLAPAVSNIATQLIAWLSSNGNYEFNLETLRQSIYDSGDLIGQKFGEQSKELVDGLGDFVVNLVQIGGAELPLIGGTFSGIIKLFNGDFKGAFKDFVDGINDTNIKIEELPDNIENTAKGFKNIILVLEGLFALNIVTRVAEGITSFLRLFSSNRLTFTGKTDVNTPMTYLRAASVNAMIQKMTAAVEFMTVYGKVVIVNGYSGNSGNPNTGTPTPTNPSPPTLPGNTPSIPRLHDGFGTFKDAPIINSPIMLPGNGGSGTGGQLLLPGGDKPPLQIPDINTSSSTNPNRSSALPGTGTNPSLPGDLGNGTAVSAATGVGSAIAFFFRKTLPAILPAIAGVGGGALMLLSMGGSSDEKSRQETLDRAFQESATNKAKQIPYTAPRYPNSMFNFGNAKNAHISAPIYTPYRVTSGIPMMQNQLSNSGMASNNTLLGGGGKSIVAASPNVSVKINNKQPLVNVKVNVNVDKAGRTTQTVIKDYGNVDNFFYNASQRIGSGVK